MHCVGEQTLRTSSLRGCQSHRVAPWYRATQMWTSSSRDWEIILCTLCTWTPSSKLFNMCNLIKVESIKPNYIQVLMLYWKINIIEAVTPFVNGVVLDYPSTQAKNNDGVYLECQQFAMLWIISLSSKSQNCLPSTGSLVCLNKLIWYCTLLRM
jgi:hypothetical protein